MKPSLTVVIPAYNEEGCLEATSLRILGVLERLCGFYELILVDDGSADSTGAVIDRLAAGNPNIRAVHNGANKGVGYSVRRGMELAAQEHLMYWTADVDLTAETLGSMLARLGVADMVIPYIGNPEFRPMMRRAVSRGYTILVNVLFGLNLRYYNCGTIYQTARAQELLRRCGIVADDYVFFAEMLIRMIRSGLSYVEVPTYHRHSANAHTDTFYFKKIRGTLRSLWMLYRSLGR